MQKFFTLRIFLMVMMLYMFTSVSMAQQVNIYNSSTYTQNFNAIGTSATATLPNGWRIGGAAFRDAGDFSTATTATQYALAGAATTVTNTGTFNFGAGSTATGTNDRAVGGIPDNSSPKSINVYLKLHNSDGSSIVNFPISYDIEKYKMGVNGDGFAVQMYYSTNGTTWTSAGADFFTAWTAADLTDNGYAVAPGDVKSVTNKTLAVTMTTGSVLYLAWNISGASGTGKNTDHAQGLGIDNFSIKGGTASPGPLSSYYETTASGDWSDYNNWEISGTPTGPWSPATVSPSATNSLGIAVLSPHTVHVTADVNIDQTTVNSGGSVIVDFGNLVVVDGTGFDLTVNGALTNNGGGIIIKSDNSGTGSVGLSTGTVTGNVIVERYINAQYGRSAWHVITAPVRSLGNNSVYYNWQNNGVNTAGIGTKVTGPSGPNATTGIDAYTLRYSLLSFDGVNLNDITNTKTELLFTTAASAANKSYFLFTDGDRNSVNAFNGSANLNTTTLRPNGGLQLGDQTFATSSTADRRTLIGNPYASPIDLKVFNANNSTSNIKSNYYYWDPYLTGDHSVGGYVTVSYDPTGTIETIVPAGANHTGYLQSSLAVFVETKSTPVTGTASVTFKETQKNATTVNNIFRMAANKVQGLAVNLNFVESATPILLDGIAANFDDSYAAEVDNYDASKFYNIGESIAFMRDTKALSVERRPLSYTDVLYLSLVGLKAGKMYQLEFKPEFTVTNLSAYLQDNYLKTKTPIDVNAGSAINFSVNGDAASTGANRFSIVFEKVAYAQPVTVKPSISVYPNPVTNGIIKLNLNNMPQGVYNVRVFNSMGQVVAVKQFNHSAGSSTETILVKGPKGILQLEVVRPDNTKFLSKVIAN